MNLRENIELFCSLIGYIRVVLLSERHAENFPL